MRANAKQAWLKRWFPVLDREVDLADGGFDREKRKNALGVSATP
jgi:hypothetical protein